MYLSTESSVIGLGRDGGSSIWETYATRASIAVGPGTVFVWDHMGLELEVLDRTFHRVRWSFDELNTMPTIRGGTAYVTGTDDSGTEGREPASRGGLHAVDIGSGDRRWRFVGAGHAFPAAVTDATVYVWLTGSAESSRVERRMGVYAVDAADGTERWRFEPETSWGPTQLAGETLVVGSDGARDDPALVYGVRPSDGSERWRFEVDARHAFPTVVTDSRAYVSAWGDDHHSYALDAATGAVAWHAERASPIGVYDDSALLHRTDGTIVAVAREDGREQWRFSPSADGDETPADRYTSAELVGETLFAVRGKTLYALDAATGDERWRFAASTPLLRYWTPTEADVYIATGTTLYAVTPP